MSANDDRRNPIISALMQSVTLSDINRLVEVMFAIQSQLSEIQLQQRQVMAELKAFRKENRMLIHNAKLDGTELHLNVAKMFSEKLSDLGEMITEYDERLENIENDLNEIFEEE